MKAHSLATTGLSMSQAQSISNLCNQAADEIGKKLRNVNNCSKVFTHQGEEYTQQEAKPLPGNTAELLTKKARYHATQAFLVENIRAKKLLLDVTESEPFNFSEERPKREEYPEHPELESKVGESWGWAQLSSAEMNEYLEAEAFAAHLGQFIHSSGILSELRAELPNISPVSFIELEAGKKRPIKVNKHHTEEQLFDLHKNIAEKHRKFEQRVNYFKAKVKNLIQSENIAINNRNADKMSKYRHLSDAAERKHEDKLRAWSERKLEASEEFEAERSKNMKGIAALRINVDVRFQYVIDEFLKKVTEE